MRAGVWEWGLGIWGLERNLGYVLVGGLPIMSPECGGVRACPQVQNSFRSPGLLAYSGQVTPAKGGQELTEPESTF
jgi:hypothetical protein